jgi:hypothetical protein
MINDTLSISKHSTAKLCQTTLVKYHMAMQIPTRSRACHKNVLPTCGQPTYLVETKQADSLVATGSQAMFGEAVMLDGGRWILNDIEWSFRGNRCSRRYLRASSHYKRRFWFAKALSIRIQGASRTTWIARTMSSVQSIQLLLFHCFKRS